MGKHRYKHFSQIKQTCANPSAQRDINMVNPISQTHGSHVIQCRMHSWNMKEMLLASLPSAVLSMVGVCRTDTGKGTSVQQVHFYCSMIKHTRSLTCYYKRPGAKRCRVWGPSSVPGPLACIPLGLYLMDIFSKPFVDFFVCAFISTKPK